MHSLSNFSLDKVPSFRNTTYADKITLPAMHSYLGMIKHRLISELSVKMQKKPQVENRPASCRPVAYPFYVYMYTRSVLDNGYQADYWLTGSNVRSM